MSEIVDSAARQTRRRSRIVPTLSFPHVCRCSMKTSRTRAKKERKGKNTRKVNTASRVRNLAEIPVRTILLPLL